MRQWFVFLATLGILAWAAPVHAQSTTGALLGDVTDATGASLPGVTIRVTNQQNGATRETITDEIGSYRFNALPAADYTMTAELSGFRTISRQNVRLPIASQIKIDFRMEVASVAETITVREEAPLVETTENAVKTLIDSRRIEELPLKSRDFLDLAMLAPGVVSDQASAQGGITDSISFAGMSEGYKSLWLEGVDFNDEVTGGGTGISSATRTALAQEAIQEFQVMANSYSAEFGRSASGAINILTKSGGNAFHGNAFYFRRDDAFDKPNFFSTTVPPFKTDQYGVTVGGPIRKDRMFFFTSYERRNQERNATVDFSRLPATLIAMARNLGYDTRTDIPTPATFNNYFAKISYTINPQHSLNFTYLYDDRISLNTEAGGTRSGDSGFDDLRHSYFGQVSLTSLFGQNLVNEFRANLSLQYLFRAHSISKGNPGGPLGKPELVFPGITFGRDNTQGRGQKNRIVSNALSYHLGKHDLKFGGEANIVPTTSELNETFHGRFEFLQDRAVVPGDNSTLPYRYTEGIEIRRNPFSERILAGLARDVSIYAWFVNDTWRIRPDVTLNLGLRYDLQFWRGDLNGKDVPADIPSNQFFLRLTTGDLRGQNFKPVPVDKNNWSPRFGLTWSPGGKGQTVVRLGWGLFYDQISTNGLRTIVAGYPGFITSQIANDSRTAGNPPNSFFPNKPPRGLLSQAGSTQFRLPNAAAEFPYTHQYTVGGSHQLTNDYAVAFDYVYLLGLHFPRNVNVNARRADGTYPIIASGTRLLLEDTGANLNIHQMQARVEKRFSNGLGFLVGYTFGNGKGPAGDPTDNYNLNADRGPIPNDVRHRIVSNSIYQLPLGIQLGGVVTYNSAPPYNITTGRDDNRDGNTNDRAPGVGFNSGRGDNFFTVDLRTSKKFAIRERMNIEVLWEMFNVFNNKNLTSYNGNALSATFGRPRVAYDPFPGQLGIKFPFSPPSPCMTGSLGVPVEPVSLGNFGVNAPAASAAPQDRFPPAWSETYALAAKRLNKYRTAEKSLTGIRSYG